jgi:hypothetical protein
MSTPTSGNHHENDGCGNRGRNRGQADARTASEAAIVGTHESEICARANATFAPSPPRAGR